ncbi:MAG: molybdate ABC transporter substrate-binding protein [Dehalococcoidales bacterium]|nr:molybdate ABC transporter substrate-binding protein [Dehalococcoidales bacterium]
MKNRLLKIIPLVIVTFVLVGFTGCKEEPVTLTVFAGAGMIDVIDDINALYMERNKNVTIQANYAAAGTLKTQIENGATCDIFISPGIKQMNSLQQQGLILSGTRQDFLTNSLVLIVAPDNPQSITDFTDLTKDAIKLVAIGDPSFVPAGEYTQMLFELLEISNIMANKLLLGSTVREVLTYVETGNVAAGIVYSTDALTSDKVITVASAPTEINAKITYPTAIVSASEQSEAARDYLNFLSSEEVITIFESYGFSTLSE